MCPWWRVEMLELFFLDVPDISSPGTGGDEDGDEDEEDQDGAGDVIRNRYFYEALHVLVAPGCASLSPLFEGLRTRSSGLCDRQTLLLVAVGFVGGLTAVGFRVLQERGG